MSFKSTEHEFESGSDIIKIIEFPFYPGEKTQGQFLPYDNYIIDVSVTGNPEKEQSLLVGTNDTLFWINGKRDFINKLEQAIIKWREGWILSSTKTVTGDEK